MKRLFQILPLTIVLAIPGVVAFVPLQGLTSRVPSSCPLSAIPYKDTCDVAIFGGGFGGLYTALALSREARSKGRRLDVTLVDPSDRFVFLPLLYDLVMGTASEEEVCPTFAELLEGTGIRHIQASFDSFSSPNLDSAKITTTSDDSEYATVNFRAAVVSVGATPQSTLSTIPGAAEYSQPFYTRDDAQEVRLLLNKMERRMKAGLEPRVAIVGGGYGGVELAACVKRRLSNADVCLLTRGSPMKGTKAEPLIAQALSRLGVKVDVCGVEALKAFESDVVPTSKNDRISIERIPLNGETPPLYENEPWDAVLWTAGSGPAYPVCSEMIGLKQMERSGRLVTDGTLRCIPNGGSSPSLTGRKQLLPIWALGDCSEIMDDTNSFAVPKTAQAAIQQADVVAANVLSDIMGSSDFRTFQYQDLGSMLTLGGPNGAVIAPKEDSALAPLFTTLLDTARIGLGLADEVLSQVAKSSTGERGRWVSPIVDNLNLSLGGYGLGVDTNSAPGTLSGTLSGAARRAIYSIRMPTNRQRAKSAVLGALSTATALSKEIAEQLSEDNR